MSLVVPAPVARFRSTATVFAPSWTGPVPTSPTWSAVALTFDNAAGTKVTVSALFDLPKNGTESSVGRFYLIDNVPLEGGFE